MKNINDVQLPLGSDNEKLEAISRKKFMQLFDEDRFILKEEFIDNGVDFRNEIMKDYRKLGFGFNFQLKAKGNAKKNIDGSYSKSIETSNIEYLINNGQPAFYGFYSKTDDKIYYEDLNEFIKSLHEKSIDWEDQQNHTLRFSKILDEDAINIIYKIVFDQGNLMRELIYKMAVDSFDINDKIIIDKSRRLIDDNEIRKMIEGLGFELINEGKWNEILYVHKKGTGNVSSSSLYNLIIGIANFYSGNIVTAISFFKTATKLKNELSDTLKGHLDYFFATSQYAIGMISSDEYDNKVSTLTDNENVGLYIRLDKAKQKYILDSTSIDESYDRYFEEVNEITNHPNASQNIKLLAQCDLLLFEGHRNNLNYTREVALINALDEIIGPDLESRVMAARTMIRNINSWFEKNKNLRDEAAKSDNYIVLHNSVVNEIKINYELDAFSSIVHVVKSHADYPVIEQPDNTVRINSMLENLNAAYAFYMRISHTENVIAVVALRYEIEHFIGKFDTAKETLSELEELVDSTDSKFQKQNLESLKHQGTTHEKYKLFKENIFLENKKIKERRLELVSQMEGMDELEKSFIEPDKDRYVIELFPINYFQFPKSKLNIVLEILKLETDVLPQFINIFETGVIPIANILIPNIIQEGPMQGYAEERGIESWENIYRIRKAFFDNKFVRFTPKFVNRL